ncbi:MAG: hypothetical protein VKQ33_15830 [Candidatus Sericytochromatia bacterium]|nr:hypothetical protein [Candidatus Sericytochromatia bacterium]
MRVPTELTVSGLIDALAGAPVAPAGATAAGVTLCMGIGLFQKALRHPVAAASPPQVAGDLELLEALRRRAERQAEAAARAEEGLASAGGDAARLAVYRASRTLLELSLLALGQIRSVLDRGTTDLLPDLELAWRLVAAAMEGAFTLCEGHLGQLPAAWASGEAEGLASQARYGRELQARAMSELAWRLRRC